MESYADSPHSLAARHIPAIFSQIYIYFYVCKKPWLKSRAKCMARHAST